jgi:hypothetical protein
VRPVRVRVGLTDGSMTEVEGEGLAEGLKVVTGLQTQAGGPTDTSNPFAPQFLRGGRGGGSR